MQGPDEITIEEIKKAAADAKPNPDRVFFRIVENRAAKLTDWAKACGPTDFRPGALAAAAVSATSDQAGSTDGAHHPSPVA
jgi:hypothetical protein